MAKAIMIQGTMSSAGKSILAAALCRIFKQDGYKVAPFKSQNMALNSYITKEGLEMGRAQVVQAEAAGIEPLVCMNPILLKPTNDTGSQVIVNGKVLGNMNAKDYFKMKRDLVPDILSAYRKLNNEYDIIVLEGAGSPAEINLKNEDIVNMGMAKMAKAPVLLVGDIDRGGVFASIVGTLMLLEEDEKELVKGIIINKFRGDKRILDPGLNTLEDMTKIKVAGTIPYMNVDIDDEDSLSEKLEGRSSKGVINIYVIRLPRISNFTDFTPFEYIEGVNLIYVNHIKDLKNPDMIIIPGSKNTIEDLLWLRQSGFEALIIKHTSKGIPIFGVCGGYQILGERLEDPDNVESGGSIKGFGLLPIKTIFEENKTTSQVKGRFTNVEGIFEHLKNIEFEGYEIHSGKTTFIKNNNNLAVIKGSNNEYNEGYNRENIYGTYVHGIFDRKEVVNTIIKALFNKKGMEFDNKAVNIKEYKESQYDLLADYVRENLGMEYIYKVLKEGV